MGTKTRARPAKNGTFDPEDLIGRISNLLTELQQVNERLIDEVAERKKAESALSEREQTIRALLNAPNDSAILIDKTGIILAANETALKRLGALAGKIDTKSKPIVGRNVYDLFSP